MSTFPQITTPPQASAEVLVNRMGETLEHQAVYGLKHSTTTGLSWGYYGGRWGGFSVADDVLTLTDAATNYIVVEIATGAISVDSASTDWDDTTDYVRAYKVTTVGGVVTAVEDHRAGPGGVHGGTGSGGGGGVSDGDKGDITVSSSGTVYTIDNDVVTYAKMQNVSATSRVLGRKTASAGDTEEVTLSELLDFIGSAAQGDILYRDSSGWARLAAGTSGQYLKTLGAAANPQWASVAAPAPSYSAKSAAYTTVLGDANGIIGHPSSDTTARVFTIDSNANVAYPLGTLLTFDNEYGAGTLTISITSDTLELVGAAGSTGSRTLASGGQATAIKVTSTKWRIAGTLLT